MREGTVPMDPSKQPFDADQFEPQLGRSVSIEQAARLLNVSRRTIYNRIREGKLQTVRTLGGSQRVLVTSLDEIRRPVLRDPGLPGPGTEPSPQ